MLTVFSYSFTHLFHSAWSLLGEVSVQIIQPFENEMVGNVLPTPLKWNRLPTMLSCLCFVETRSPVACKANSMA